MEIALIAVLVALAFLAFLLGEKHGRRKAVTEIHVSATKVISDGSVKYEMDAPVQLKGGSEAIFFFD